MWPGSSWTKTARTAIAATLLLLVSGPDLSARSSKAGSQVADEASRNGRVEATDTAARWPMRVEDFLAGQYLQRSDVLLTSQSYSLSSYLIRRATGSPFSHAAAVFTTPVQEPGISSTFVIEAGTRGVELTNLKDYIEGKSGIIAIKRLKQSWWDIEKQSRVRGVLLDTIKTEYNYWAVWRWMREVWFGLQSTVRGNQTAIESYAKRNWQRPNAFICSGLVQFGFVEAIAEFIEKRKLPPWALSDVVFSVDAGQRLIQRQRWEELQRELAPADYEALIDSHIPEVRAILASELEAITPEDLSQTDKLGWEFVIKHGWVWRITSHSDLSRHIEH